MQTLSGRGEVQLTQVFQKWQINWPQIEIRILKLSFQLRQVLYILIWWTALGIRVSGSFCFLVWSFHCAEAQTTEEGSLCMPCECSATEPHLESSISCELHCHIGIIIRQTDLLSGHKWWPRGLCCHSELFSAQTSKQSHQGVAERVCLPSRYFHRFTFGGT